jgi:hypothetical protein
MKIIGSTNNGFIVEASEDEIANLCGYYSKYQHSEQLRTNVPVKVGDSINVAQMYSQLILLASLESRMADARGILKTVTGGLTMVDPIIREVVDLAQGKTE